MIKAAALAKIAACVCPAVVVGVPTYVATSHKARAFVHRITADKPRAAVAHTSPAPAPAAAPCVPVETGTAAFGGYTAPVPLAALSGSRSAPAGGYQGTPGYGGGGLVFGPVGGASGPGGTGGPTMPGGAPTPPPAAPGAVPEAAIWVTMVAGFGMIGGALRRSARVQYG